MIEDGSTRYFNIWIDLVLQPVCVFLFSFLVIIIEKNGEKILLCLRQFIYSLYCSLFGLSIDDARCIIIILSIRIIIIMSHAIFFVAGLASILPPLYISHHRLFRKKFSLFFWCHFVICREFSFSFFFGVISFFSLDDSIQFLSMIISQIMSFFLLRNPILILFFWFHTIEWMNRNDKVELQKSTIMDVQCFFRFVLFLMMIETFLFKFNNFIQIFVL